MPTVQVTGPAVEPLTLAEAKTHLRVDVSDDDTLITSLIVVARQGAEAYTRRSMCTQTWKLVLDTFPAPGINVGSANWYGPQWGTSPGPLTTLRPNGTTGFEIVLERGPIASVESITYTDQNAVTQTLAGSAYVVDLVSEPARIVPAYGTTWPATLNQINAVTVNFTAGYGVAAAVPQSVKQWMLLQIGAMYENREAFLAGRSITITALPFIDGLLDPYRVLVY